KGRKEKIPSKGSTARSAAFPDSPGPAASVGFELRRGDYYHAYT
ncbi:hypothetical protein A2U01_0095039, partial [Trifolium medium]|nr:hypothetical protein [Trifolium medium]